MYAVFGFPDKFYLKLIKYFGLKLNFNFDKSKFYFCLCNCFQKNLLKHCHSYYYLQKNFSCAKVAFYLRIRIQQFTRFQTCMLLKSCGEMGDGRIAEQEGDIGHA